MNFNLFILRLKIMFYLILGKIKKNNPQIKLPNRESVNKVLLFFPKDENEFRLSLYIFKDLFLIDNNTKYTLIINKNFFKILNFQSPNIFFVEFGKRSMKFCNNEQRKMLLKEDLDVVVDLNTNFFFGSSQFISYLKSRIKIGFKSNFSDIFYNMQLNPKKTGSVEMIFVRMKEILDSL